MEGGRHVSQPAWVPVRGGSGSGLVIGEAGEVQKGSSGSSQLAECLWQLLEQNFTHRLVLDLNEIAAVDSSLMGELTRLYKRIREHDGVLRLCGLSPRNRRALQASSLEDRLPAFGSREEAVMGGRDLCHPK